MSAEDQTTCKVSAVGKAQERQGPDDQWISRKPGALMLVGGAYVLGGGGMLAWLAFLLLGPPVPWESGLGMTGRLTMDALLCLLFFFQHSLMVRREFRLRLTRMVRADFHGAFFASASGLCLLVLVLLWQPAGTASWTPPGWVRWTMLGIFLAAGAGTWWGSRALGEFDALGVKPALRAANRSHSMAPAAFTIRGPYRWVRHPLYFFSLIIIWSGPVFTLDRLLHNGLWTVWVIVGAAMEERDLLACFGDAYRTYRETVPMLLPRSLRPLVPDGGETPSGHP
jgi:protein-S-isoprenylcysteine O-methyltransferase Ste14